MATDIVQGLFGMTPESYQMQQQAAAREQAAKFASMNPFQQANYGLYLGANQIGGGIGGMLGAQDPMLQRATAIRSLAQGVDISSTKGLEEYANRLQQNGLTAEAAQLGQVLAARKQQEAQAKLTEAKGNKELQAFEREDKLREELSKLGPDATDKDVLKVVSRFGDPGKVLQALQTSQDKAAQRELTKEEKDKQRAHELERDRLRAQDRADLAALVASLKNNAAKPLSATEIKDINRINTNIKSTTSTIEKADDFINKIDKGEMKFGMGENLLGIARTGLGRANESDLNKVEFEQYVAEAVNGILNLAKGAQTEGDAKRAQKQIVDGLSKNDSKAVKRGLEGLKRVLQDAKSSDMESLELYSAERGGKNLTPSAAPAAPKTPKATRRFNPATGQFEAI
jgi:hypothetical protein